MSRKFTLVIEYADSQQLPKFGLDMDVLDGKVTAVACGDRLASDEQISELRTDIGVMVDKITNANNS